MPNLCRRSRISPPSNRLINFPFSSRSPPIAPGSTGHSLDQMIKKSEERLSLFASIKRVFKSSSQKSTTTTTTTSRESVDYSHSDSFRQPTPGMVYTTTTTLIRPNMNIGPFLEEDEHTINQRTYKNRTSSVAAFNNQTRGT